MLMLFRGRLGALTIVAARAQLPQHATPPEYPEEQLLIG